MTLQKITANNAYAFFFFDNLTKLHGEPMFFETRQEAVYAAKACGLKVTNRNTVKAMEGGK